MNLKRSIILTSLLILSCASSKEAQEKFKVMAIEKYKDNIAYVFNESKTHVLCIKTVKPTTAKPLETIRFFVYDLKNETVVCEENYSNGTVRWFDDRAIQVSYSLGVDSKDPSVPHAGTYIFDIITKQKKSDKTETK